MSFIKNVIQQHISSEFDGLSEWGVCPNGIFDSWVRWGWSLDPAGNSSAAAVVVVAAAVRRRPPKKGTFSKICPNRPSKKIKVTFFGEKKAPAGAAEVFWAYKNLKVTFLAKKKPLREPQKEHRASVAASQHAFCLQNIKCLILKNNNLFP